MDSNVVKKPKTVMTDKQKAARCVNLAAGRKKRMEAIKQRKEKPDEYDISSNDGSIDESDSSDSSDNDAFVLTKAKKKSGKTESLQKNLKSKKQNPKLPIGDNLRDDVDELKSMIELANMQKKQHKASKKRSSKKSGGTKIVVLPQHASAPVITSQIRAYTDSSLDALKKSLGIL